MYLKQTEEGAVDLENLLAILQEKLLHNNIGVQDVNSFDQIAAQKYAKIFQYLDIPVTSPAKFWGRTHMSLHLVLDKFLVYMLRLLVDKGGSSDEQLLEWWENCKAGGSRYFFVRKWMDDNADGNDDVLTVFKYFTEIGIPFEQFE